MAICPECNAEMGQMDVKCKTCGWISSGEEGKKDGNPNTIIVACGSFLITWVLFGLALVPFTPEGNSWVPTEAVFIIHLVFGTPILFTTWGILYVFKFFKIIKSIVLISIISILTSLGALLWIGIIEI